jgi:hypothetical protein
MRAAGLLLLMIVFTQIASSWAQQSYEAAQPYQPQQEASTETPDDVQTNISDLLKQTIPEKDVLLLRDLDRIDTEIANVTNQRNVANAWKDSKSFYDQIIDRVSKQSRVIATFDCDNNLSKYRDASATFFRDYSALGKFSSMVTDDLAEISLPLPARDDTALDVCKNAKAKFSSPEYADKLN